MYEHNQQLINDTFKDCHAITTDFRGRNYFYSDNIGDGNTCYPELVDWLDQQLKTQEELSKMNTRATTKPPAMAIPYGQPIHHLELPEDTITRTQAHLKELITPYVEVGFDAHQIKEELAKQDERLVPLGHIESIVSIILGEQ